MKTFFTLILLTFNMLFCDKIFAQEVKRPITAKVINEVKPASPGENMTWVKGHWQWNGVKYAWEKGVFVEKKQGYSWVDGQWERDQKSGWWQYNDGYWQKDTEFSNVSNDKNTAKEDKAAKDKRQKNKTNGLFIKTGNSE